MRPLEKSTTCQLQVTGLQTGESHACGLPVTGQGRWRFCTEEHYLLSRKPYQRTHNRVSARRRRLSKALGPHRQIWWTYHVLLSLDKSFTVSSDLFRDHCFVRLDLLWGIRSFFSHSELQCAVPQLRIATGYSKKASERPDLVEIGIFTVVRTRQDSEAGFHFYLNRATRHWYTGWHV
jgi:hypothetical protein